MVRVLDSADVGRLVSMAEAIAAVREAFAAADRGGAVMPAPFGMYLPDAGGEVHVKGAYLPGAPVFAVKTATGFYRNAGLGLPVSGGMTMVHDAVTGALRMLIADGGLLTELRTAAARQPSSTSATWPQLAYRSASLPPPARRSREPRWSSPRPAAPGP